MRESTADHIDNECMEKLLICTNDDCKQDIKRKDFKDHVEEKCQHRIISCDFVKYGCKVTNIKANQIQTHLNQYQIQHLSDKFDFITKQVLVTCFVLIYNVYILIMIYSKMRLLSHNKNKLIN